MRTARAEELRTALAGAIARFTRDEIVAMLAGTELPIAPALSRTEMLAHPHFRARGTFATGADGSTRVGHPVRYANRPALPPGRSPGVGEHQGARFRDRSA